jgi:hypothetical protein
VQCRDVLREGARHGHLGFAVHQLRAWRSGAAGAVGKAAASGEVAALAAAGTTYAAVLATVEADLLALLQVRQGRGGGGVLLQVLQVRQGGGGRG